MSLNGRTGEFNRWVISEEMAKLGLQADKLCNGEQFLAEFTLPIATLNQSINKVVIDANPAAPLCTYDLQGTLRLNMIRLVEIIGAEHRYPLYIMTALQAASPKFTIQVAWDALHFSLSRCVSIETLKDIHRNILLLLFHYRKNIQLNVYDTCQFPWMSLSDKPYFLARPGNVELRALRTVLGHDDQIGPIIREIVANYKDSTYMYRPGIANDADVSDLNWNIRMLITNAGMYGDADTLEQSVREWADHYVSGLRNSNELFSSWEFSIHLEAVKLLAENTGRPFDRKQPVKSGDLDNFYKQIAGRRVLFITPFASSVDQVIKSGNIRSIWKNVQPPEFEVFTLQAFVSTYPNAPHRSWHETYEKMTNMIDEAVSRHRIDIAVASCGCYGIPLMNYCFTNHHISAMYYGNMMNMFFGVKQNAFRSFYSQARLEYWAEPYIGWDHKPINIERIDDGRYVSTPT